MPHSVRLAAEMVGTHRSVLPSLRSHIEIQPSVPDQTLLHDGCYIYLQQGFDSVPIVQNAHP